MARAGLFFWCPSLLILLGLFDSAQSDFNESFYCTDLSQAFPLLANLSSAQLKRAPQLGGQNFTLCCLHAVSESYVIQNGHILNNPSNDYVGITPEKLNTSQFPCGATYDGNADGAPLVTVPFSWCSHNCGGWEKSTNAALSQWVQPFVGFILPAAVFCLNVPRTSIFTIADILFDGLFNHLPDNWYNFKVAANNLKVELRATYQSSQNLGPSAAPEDIPKSLVKLLQNRVNVGLPLVLTLLKVGFSLVGPVILLIIRAKFLLIIKATSAAVIALFNTIIWVAVVFCTAGPMILSGLHEATLDRKVLRIMRRDLSEEVAKGSGNGRKGTNMRLFYKRIHILYAVLVGNLTIPNELHDDNPMPRTVWKDIKGLIKSRISQPEPEDSQSSLLKDYKIVTDMRLKALLNCQPSFGTAVGAPVVFFVGSFLFSVISNLSVVGDNDTSHALAFGMWWITIPHVAIVSGCLLAGNNPNTLEVIVGDDLTPWPARPQLGWFRLYYSSVYEPVWMWERGPNKRRWINAIYDEYSQDGDAPESENLVEDKHKEFHLTLWYWTLLISITMILLILPFILAFLQSFYTPTVGLSCRSLTFLLYFLFQFCLSGMWISYFFSQQKLWRRRPFAKNMTSDDPQNWPTLFLVVLVFTSIGSIFTTIVGTFLQIIGVYRNCICTIPVGYWQSKKYPVVLSSNSPQAIQLAKSFWLPTGVASIVLLMVVSYSAWWYQRHWRLQFKKVVESLLGPEKNSNKIASGVEEKGAGINEVGAVVTAGGAPGPIIPIPATSAEKELMETTVIEKEQEQDQAPGIR